MAISESLAGAPRCDIPFRCQCVLADFHIIKIRLFERIDVIYPGRDMNLDLTFGNGNMIAAVLLRFDTEAGANMFDEGIADLDFKLIGRIAFGAEKNIALE